MNSILRYRNKLIMWYDRHDFVISQNKICEIDFVSLQNQIIEMKKKKLYFITKTIMWYQKFDVVISQNRICCITCT